MKKYLESLKYYLALNSVFGILVLIGFGLWLLFT